jgi:hypothetical protein
LAVGISGSSINYHTVSKIEATASSLSVQIISRRRTTTTMNWFGRKKDTQQPSAVSSTSRPAGGGGGGAATRAKTANTVVSLRENNATQEKREQHLEKKIEMCVKEAKEKMAKKDKKGEFGDKGVSHHSIYIF